MTDNNSLRTHGGNLAAVLLRLEREDVRRFEFICRQIQQALPVFDRFELEESYGKVYLRWKERDSEKTFGAHLTSDGSLRFFALVTLLNLPPEMLPDVLLLDEPELGLHPAAITLIGEMIKALAEERQVIVATQSPLLVDAFDLDEFFVLEAPDGQTKVHRLEPDRYRAWLEDDFTPGTSGSRTSSGAVRDPPRRIRGRPHGRAIRQESPRRPPLGSRSGAKADSDWESPRQGQTRGGAVSVERLASEMGSLYWNFDAVTSLVDSMDFVKGKTKKRSMSWRTVFTGESTKGSPVIPTREGSFPTYSSTNSKGCFFRT